MYGCENPIYQNGFMFSGKVQYLALLNVRDIKTDFCAAPNLINGDVWLQKSIITDLCVVVKYSTYLKSWIVYNHSFFNTIRFTSQKHVQYGAWYHTWLHLPHKCRGTGNSREFPGNFNNPQMFPRKYTRTYVPDQIQGIGEFPGNSPGRCNQDTNKY